MFCHLHQPSPKEIPIQEKYYIIETSVKSINKEGVVTVIDCMIVSCKECVTNFRIPEGDLVSVSVKQGV